LPIDYAHTFDDDLLSCASSSHPVAASWPRGAHDPGRQLITDENQGSQKRPANSAGLFVFMDYSKLDGLVPAVIQDAESSEVLMVGFMNEQALAQTQRTGYATFFSRTRQKLWMKGESSGNKLEVVEILVDCDDDTVLVKVKRLGDGNVCHTGERTCFYRALK
jgi:phosphoribosyl-AMP cyclohydrolase